MSRLFVRGLATSSRALEAAGVTSAAAGSSSSAVPIAATTSASAPTIKEWTPKGRPIPVRPPRTTRVSLPSGWPEPPSYPPPASYYDEINEIKASLPSDQAAPKPHPLWAFFHVPPAARGIVAEQATAPQDCGSVERLEVEELELSSGRAWKANELRNKSFEDLHVLWYVLLRERNVLATQREERRRLSLSSAYGGELLTKRAFRCRKSMARIKQVLNERRLALIAAGQQPPEISLLDEEVQVPFSVPGMNDPAAQVEALAGTTPVIDVRKVEPKAARSRPAQRVEEEGELDLFEGSEEGETAPKNTSTTKE